MKNLEEYVSSTPQIAEDGGIVLGSKETTAFLVNAKTGKIIRTYRMSDPPSTMQNIVNGFPYNTTVKKQSESGSDLNTDDLPLYITRTDYRLTSFRPNSDKVLWNMTVAEIGAAFLCQDVEKSLGASPPDLESSEPGLPYNMPLPCQSRARVYRFRNHNMFEASTLPVGPSKALPHDMMLPASGADVLPSQPNVEKVLELLPLSSSGNFQEAHDSKDLDSVLLLPFNENSGITNMDDASNHASITPIWMFGIGLITFLVFAVQFRPVFRTIVKFPVQGIGVSSTNILPKKKRSRKNGKGGFNTGKQDKEENEVQHAHNDTGGNFFLNLNQPISYSTGGRKIGKLVVSNNEIAKGSNGTIVLEGVYEGRPVAVKRLVRAYNDVALKEIQNLIVSDRHPNIVRWFGVEQDQDFVYLALERCTCSLDDLVLMHLKSSANPAFGNNLDAEFAAECAVRLDSIKSFVQDFELWNSDGYPSHLLLKLMRLYDFLKTYFRLRKRN